MQVFVRVIEKGSFSAVAKERGIGQPAVSKQISALEDELGTELIRRTSRSIALTEAGRPEGAHPRGRPFRIFPPPYGVKAASIFCCLPRYGNRDVYIGESCNNRRRRLRSGDPLRRSPGLHSGCAKIRADEYRSHRHS